MPQDARDALAELDALNGEEANLAFANWAASAYPQMIEEWRQVGEQGGLGELSPAVIPLLEQQHAVAEEIVAAEGNLDAIDSTAANLLTEAEMESFRTTLSGVESDLSSVRDAAAGNDAISDAVEQAGASSEDVVAIDVLDEGVIVYTYSG